jgi:N-sulfoglucosamine sulfohydrolase
MHTGMYPVSTGAQHMRTASFRLDRDDSSTEFKYEAVPPEEVKLFPEYLREAGYFTVIQNKLDYLAVSSLYRHWKELVEEDSSLLTKENRLYFAPEKPAEELYDIVNDPYELHNLAEDEHYSDIKREMCTALDQWIEETDVWSDYSGNRMILEEETDMINTMWPGMEQPFTETPIFSKTSGRFQGPFELKLSSPTGGASIVYAIVDSSVDQDAASHHWQLYSGPITITDNCSVIAQALRYGY